jgi:hypothetical protein
MLTRLFRQGNSKKFWNKIRNMKDIHSNAGDISINTLRNHFSAKFQEHPCNWSETIKMMNSEVSRQYASQKDRHLPCAPFGPLKMMRLIDRLKTGRAPGCDGILAEHLQHAKNTSLPHLLCKVLNTCVMFGVVPSSFKQCLLVPILKKPSLNPALPNNYRPIMVSSIISKLLEYAVLDDTRGHNFHDLQYGFVEGRGTKMAIATAHDTIGYCNERGSPVFTCMLDAERAFDGIPSCVLLYKAMFVLDISWWRTLYVWYQSATAVIKYMGKHSSPFNVEKGTRQGGLTSPLLFNIVYQDMIKELSDCMGGLRIGSHSYSVFCYADDILLMSTTVTGLQGLIDCANKYLVNHGLSFNPSKSSCTIMGKHYFTCEPHWYLNDVEIENSESFNYLGAIFSSSSKKHCENRMSQCRKAFYSLQSSGICVHGVEPKVKAYLWKTALQPILCYGNDCINLAKTDLLQVEKLQAKLIKSSLGLSKYLRTTPLLQALYIRTVNNLSTVSSFKLLRNLMFNSSRSRKL